jgi:phage terminase large subunit-like protein
MRSKRTSAAIEKLRLGEELAALPVAVLSVLDYRAKWLSTCRKNQIPPGGEWNTWLIITGRGWGKTLVGAQAAWWFAETYPGIRTAVVAPRAEDHRKVTFDGETGLLSVIPHESIADYNRALHELTLKNGSSFAGYSSEAPRSLRGPQHHLAWGDEIAHWSNYDETMSNLSLGLRLGHRPRSIFTTTPSPGHKGLRTLAESPTTIVTTGTLLDNIAHLPSSFVEEVLRRYQGTRLGRQEIMGEMLDDVVGALWRRDNIERLRRPFPDLAELNSIVVAVDPAASDTQDSDETGIVVVGRDAASRGWVLEDLSGRYSPKGWAQAAVSAYNRYRANYIVAEKNNGGDMVSHTINVEDPRASVRLVHASRGKYARAEPVSAMYEQQRIFHAGAFDVLEDQLCTWEPNGKQKSPDRLDALVWGFTELLVDTGVEDWDPKDIVVGRLPSYGAITRDAEFFPTKFDPQAGEL